MTTRRSHHTHLQYGAIVLLLVSFLIAGYYYMNNPTYQPQVKEESKPAVQGIATDTSEPSAVSTEPSAVSTEKLIIHIPDTLDVTIEDQQGRVSGYSPDVRGFKNEIPYSDVIVSAGGDKYIAVSHEIASKYAVTVRGQPRRESLLIELENSETGSQSELISLNTLSQKGTTFILTVHPLSIESSDESLYVQ